MLSRLVLDKLIPLPTEEELLEQIKSELADGGFHITNFKSGGVFYTLMRIFIRIKIELLSLCRTMLGNLFVSSADRVEWLEVRAADFSKYRKPALKTEGNITLTRTNTDNPVKISKGCIFKTRPSSTGEELRFFSVRDVTFAIGEEICLVPVVAETAGSAYNVPADKITVCLIHLESVSGITNTADWITREGSDIEEMESLRSRTLNSFADLATHPTRDKYKSACEAVPGVLYVSVNDQHPRGQGTVDIIVTSSTGEASEALLADVQTAAMRIAGPYDNLLIQSSDTVRQDVAVTVILSAILSADGIIERVEETIRNLFEINRNRTLNEFYLSDLIVAIKQEVPTAKGISIITPDTDIVLGTDKVIVLGDVSVTIERV